MSAAFEVVATGPLTTVQDRGRPGHAAWGVAWSGAADRASLALANRLVGNPPDAAALEVTLGGLQLRTRREVTVALAGAPCPVTIDGRPEGHNAPFTVPAGALLAVDVPTRGLRSYLSVRGGIDVEPVLGSRATDRLGGLGPAPLAEGDQLAVGEPDGELPGIEVAPGREPAAGEVTLRVRLGPRDDWFSQEAVRVLLDSAWAVADDSNRIGLRLDGPHLERSRDDELPSEGLVRGALQVPPAGRPTIFLADHPVTGGYPVVAVLLDADVDAAAQLRPGQTLRLRAVGESG